MNTGKWIIHVVALALAVLNEPASALSFRSVNSGNWSAISTWEVPDPNNPGKWITPGGPPGCGDTASIRHDVAVDVDTPISGITIDSGASLKVNHSETLTLCGASPSVVATGSLIVEGLLKLTSSSGTAYVDLRGCQKVPSAGGEVRGLASASSRPEIRINAGAGVAAMINLGTVSGSLWIRGVNNGTYDAEFENHGIVTANAAAELLLDSSLDAIYDSIVGSQWRVESNGSASLTFDRGSSVLFGSVQLLVSGGTLNVNSSVTTLSLVYNDGAIFVASGQLLCFTLATGSCPTLPTSCLVGAFASCP